ncbi:uncharacterized protein ARMOST_17460 [Armillaria ostoyae]|uniref:Uncharacterized protein n=1 Tax=Armillaria ostoyae TaxID=47428 RepID=A0A284RZ32_ARMOS|nr:uncharacterized protein ARMOST_17460 [Armillaria ostoyae]
MLPLLWQLLGASFVQLFFAIFVELAVNGFLMLLRSNIDWNTYMSSSPRFTLRRLDLDAVQWLYLLWWGKQSQ